MARPLVVLESFQEPGPATNPYIVLLARGIAAVPGVELRTFTWRAALLKRLDVVHVHWPEVVLRGSSRVKTFARQTLFLAFLVRLALTRTPVVRTLHNLAPHDGVSLTERLLLGGLDRLTTARILINDAAEQPPGPPATVIVHGHYRDWFAGYAKPAGVPGRIATFGLLKPYKGVDRLLTAFRDAARADPALTLRVAGRPASASFAAELRGLAAGEERIELELAYIDDEDLVRLVGEAELVALPYRQMYNSGGVLSALSLDRPVLVPDTEVNRLLAAEVGPGWVHLFSGELTAQHLTDALAAVREGPAWRPPDLSGREWDDAGREHVAVFRRAVEARRRGRRNEALRG